MRLILLTCLCFVGLTANNVLLFLDVAVIAAVELRPWRTFFGLAGLGVLLYGMVTAETT